MAFTASDLQDLLHLLEEHPQSQVQLRALLLPDGLQTLSERFDRLTEIVERLAEAQQRTEQRLQELAERTDQRFRELAEAQQRTEQRLRELAEAQRRTEQRLEQLAEAQRRTEQRLEQLAEAQRRTEQRLEQLAEAQQRTEQRLQELTERTDRRFQELAEAQRRTEQRLEQLVEQVQGLVSWQRGEAGRREGERYEHRIVRRAPALFHGGQGGATDQPFVQQRLTEILESLPVVDTLTDDEDPFLADLIWWKDDQFVVVEASLQVNGNDVARAARRAETLRRGNVQAMGLVIGQAWADPHIRHQAEARNVHWWVGDDLSGELVAFRRASS